MEVNGLNTPHPQRHMVLNVVDLLKSRRFDALESLLRPSFLAYEGGTLSDRGLEHAWPHLGLQRVDLVESATEWAQAYPQSYAAQVFVAHLRCAVAWQARGSATSDRTSEKQFEVMQQHFDAAFPHVHRALVLTARPTLAIGAGLIMTRAGQDDPGHDFLALAHTHLPHSPLLYVRMMWVLNPKWGGSTQELQSLFQDAQVWAVSNGWPEADRATIQPCYEAELADVERCEGDVDQAILMLKKSLQHSPHWDVAHSRLADMYNLKDQMQPAIDHLRQALRMAPSANRFNQLGDFYQQVDRQELAVACFEEAMLWGSADAAGSMIQWLSEQRQQADAEQRPALEQQIALVGEYGLQQYSCETMFYLGSIEFFQRGDAPAKARAYQWWRQAAEWGHRTAMFNLGIAHFDGSNGQALNKDQAIDYFTRAAARGHLAAHERLGKAYLRGDCVVQNDERAAHHLDIAADGDNVYAMRDWVFCLWFGRGTPQDRPTARQVLDRLKKLDTSVHSDACDAIGVIASIKQSLRQLFSGAHRA